MKLSLKKIFKEAEQDLEAWSRQMEEDDNAPLATVPTQRQQGVPPKWTPKTGVDIQKLWGGVSLPGDTDDSTMSDQHLMQLDNFIRNLDMNTLIGPQEIKFLKSISPGGDIENLVIDLQTTSPNLYNRLLDAGIEESMANQANQFVSNPAAKAAGPKPAAQPPQYSQGRQASWTDLIKQNPNYDTMHRSQKRSFQKPVNGNVPVADEATKQSTNPRAKVAP